MSVLPDRRVTRLARPAGRADLASLEERLGLLMVTRLALAASVVLTAALAPGTSGFGPGTAALPVAAYAALAVGAGVLTRHHRGAALAAHRVLLGLDGVWLLAVTAPSGGPTSPLLVLWSVYLVAAVLLGSGRDGIRLAVWAAALLVLPASYPASIDRALGATVVPGHGVGAVALAVAGLWAVTGCTIACSRVSERELRRNRRELEVLAAMATSLEETDDLAQSRRIVLRHVTAALEARRSAMVVPGGPHLRWEPGLDGEVVDDHDGGTVLGAVVDAAQVARRPLARRRLDPVADGVAAGLLPGARNVVAAPLGGGPDAPVVLVEHGGHADGERVARRTLLVLGQFTSHAALALGTVTLVAELARKAGIDELTGVANRRQLDAALVREVASATRRGEALAVVIVDIDHFKAVNDRYGHLEGDRVLRRLATALVDVCRDMDLVARYGGEEFVLLLPACTANDATRVTARLDAALAADPTLRGLTVSAGVACLGDNGADGPALLAAADGALYVSKRTGRARTTVAEPTPSALTARR